AHWSGSGPDFEAIYDSQARNTIDMMSKSRGARVLIGDLNVFEGTFQVCKQLPVNSPMMMLRTAGYVDGWPAVHGGDEGYTGMTNRAGCGRPDGYGWKRIDYAWSRGVMPVSMDRFGVVPAGEAAPSDHYGIIAEYPR